jgi:predicted nucleic acid-binding protein
MVGRIMFLVDTNIWLEVIMEQEKAHEAREFLNKISPKLLYITDFSLYSIGVFLSRRKRYNNFLDFLKDAFEQAGVRLLRLEISEMEIVIQMSSHLKLDFDDAYQYAVAEKYELEIVSFDGDFDRTHRGRKTPQDILNESKNV